MLDGLLLSAYYNLTLTLDTYLGICILHRGGVDGHHPPIRTSQLHTGGVDIYPEHIGKELTDKSNQLALIF